MTKKQQLRFFPVLAFLLLGCSPEKKIPGELLWRTLTYKDIPSITKEEIDAIEKLKNEYPHFTFGAVESTEAFINEDGEINGLSVLLCDWLSAFFEIPFKPVLIAVPAILESTQNGDIDFSNALLVTREQQEIYHTIDPIGMNSIKLIRKADSQPISAISQTRLPRYGFLTNSISINEVATAVSPNSYIAVMIEDFTDAYPLIERNEIDAFILLNIFEEYFDMHDGLIAEDFIPILYCPVSMSTGKAELVPIISAVQKALEYDELHFFNELAKQGYEEYQRHKLYARLTDEEKDYLRNNTVIPYTVGYEFFPISFFNRTTNTWEGSSIDLINELSKLTGFDFAIVNDSTMTSEGVHTMLLDGSAYMTPALVYVEERQDDYIWAKNTWTKDKLALISKREFPNISTSDLPYMKIGMVDIGYSTMFIKRFPLIQNIKEYPTQVALMRGIQRDEVDMIIITMQGLRVLSSYYEVQGYKINFLDRETYDLTFAFGKDHAVLCSIIDKALLLVDTERIVDHWEGATYDHQARLLRAQRPWLLAAIILSCIILVLLSILFIKNRTAKKRLENVVTQRTSELEHQSSLLQIIIDSIPNIVFCKDLALNYTMCNTVAEEFMGVNKSSIIGKQTEGFMKVSAETLAFINNMEQNVIKNEKRVVYETWIPSHNNTNHLFEVVEAPMIINGSTVGLTGIAHDITERKAMEEEALSASQYKSTFLATMSHEIRTPMNSIMGFAELATDSDSMPKIKDYLGKITDSTDWLLRIINDILDISKIEAGKMEIETVPFDLEDIFSRCQSVILPSTKEKGLLLKVHTEPLTGKKLLGDPIRIYQVLINLLNNAVKFTHTGTVKFSSLIRSTDDHHATVYFEVADSGIGMTTEQIEKIFDPFIQADTSTTRNYGGSGLGLAIAKNIVELLGGKLTVESAVGIGSTFSFEIVFETIDASEDGSSLAKIQNLERPYFDGMVLVCDDNALNQELICAHLERLGLIAMAAENGKIAVEMVMDRKINNKRPFDLIFMDMFMPVMDGMEAASIIQNLGTGTPIVAMTANVMASEQEKYKQLGMPDCLGKPFTSQELWYILLNYLVPVSSAPINGYDDNEDLQRKLQINFYRNNQAVHNEIASAVAIGDTQLAHRLAHSLKGNAGLIGKIGLRDAAAEVEALLRDGTAVIWETKMNNLRSKLESTLDELKPLIDEYKTQEEPQDANEKQALNTQQVLALFATLEHLLETINPECVDLLEAIRAVPGTEPLVQQVENYEFESALRTLNALRALLETDHGD